VHEGAAAKRGWRNLALLRKTGVAGKRNKVSGYAEMCEGELVDGVDAVYTVYLQ
jgi:hypothetical protein